MCPHGGLFPQVNTSGEAQKGGVDEGQLIDLVRHIKDNCPNLEFRGEADKVYPENY